tara:strand:+ start:234 stop:704 length:471 start_codon:yes stop_codon:yes gene_type:complete
MKLVLLKDIKHLGKVGQEVEVKAGFARNFLLPTKSALTPTEENLKVIGEMKDELMKKEQEAKDAALAIKEKLSGYTQNFKLEVKKDSDELFGSVSLQNVADQIKSDGFDIEKRQINLPMGSIKELGSFRANISLHSEVSCDIEIIVEKAEETKDSV